MKPANILTKDGVYKIADFGFSKVILFPDTPCIHTSIGSPLYESLENLEGRPYSSKNDVWSLGVIYYETLFGKLPMGEKVQYLNEKSELIPYIENMK